MTIFGKVLGRIVAFFHCPVCGSSNIGMWGFCFNRECPTHPYQTLRRKPLAKPPSEENIFDS